MQYQIKNPSNKRDVICTATSLKKARLVLLALNDKTHDYKHYIIGVKK